MAPERPGPDDHDAASAVHRGPVTIPVVPLFSLSSALMQLKAGDGAGHMVTTVKVEDVAEERATNEDDDLTSLSWLQDKNLLKGMNIRAAETQESPTSDYVEDGASDLADSTSSSGHSASPAPGTARHKHPQHMPYDPLVHTSSKPPYSFSCLIFMAIEDSPVKALPVKEIYAWIQDHFPYFQNAPTGWKNSVRHNLSLNKCFRKVEKAPNLGKGSLWMVDGLYRPNLMQALQKAPYHPYTSSELGGVKEFIPSSALLSRRGGPAALRAGGRPGAPGEPDDPDSQDDVDAAAAMLALKHGRRVVALDRVHSFVKPDPDVCCEPPCLLDLRKKSNRASKLSQDGTSGTMIPVITTSPSEDHTYSAATSTPLNPHVSYACSSRDEGYGDDSDREDGEPRPVCLLANIANLLAAQKGAADSEEQRKIAEGADALLNLAGIATRKRPPSRAGAAPPAKRPAPRGRRKGAGRRAPHKRSGTADRRRRSASSANNINNNNNDVVVAAGAKVCKVASKRSSVSEAVLARHARSEERATRARR
ncbi:forkhead box protein N3-like [Bacillus rossius redtenbacheri]|uniref:forkhead box protein N3-like n=1 Tax=Bacillus rossius redtenbacheri TaxID=93214 RepID=UPI002FDC7D49